MSENAWNIIKLFSDRTRLRILHLLKREQLSVGELQDILDMGQSRISTQLAQLLKLRVVTARRDGKKTFYALAGTLSGNARALLDATLAAIADDPEIRADEAARARVIEKRTAATQAYFDAIAKRNGNPGVPGRSDGGIVQMLLSLVPPLVIADLGSGRGIISQQLAFAAKKIYCVDNSRTTLSEGREFMKKHGVRNVEFLLGDIQKVPLRNAVADVALLSQSLHHAARPDKAIAEAFRILKPGGKIIILDLNKHPYEIARERYHDTWLGFSKNEIEGWLADAGFAKVSSLVFPADDGKMKFETLFARGDKPEK
ncbi:MAG: ArsR/SmtB family transcription factor [Candidatus Spyradosoma sp.]